MDNLALEHWPLQRLIEYARNPRRNDDVVDRMCAAIREFGFRIPIVARSDGTVVDGHLRLKAARRLELPTVPVVLADELSDAQIKAFRLLANRSANWAEWDDELLKLELEELQSSDFPLELTGFDAEDLNRLLETGAAGAGADAGENEAPEPPPEAVTRAGDLWLLGEHRLLCGDATAATDVGRLLNGMRPHLMVTDSPYGVEYDPSWRLDLGLTATNRRPVKNDDRADWREAWQLFPGDVIYAWHASLKSHIVAESLEASGFKLRTQIIWVKPHFALGRGDYHFQHEPMFYAVRAGATGHWQGARDQSSVWHIGNAKEEDEATIHGTQKPVECMRRPILNNSERGDLVYEPFAGSGSTVIAAESTGRRCLAMEIDPKYCDVIVQRWQKRTGKDAILESAGETFEATQGQRTDFAAGAQ